MELKQKAISGVKWVTVSTVINNLLQLALISILARLLSPSDFGLMALVNVVIEFSSFFIDAGFSNIIIHKQDINHRQLSSIYWLSIATGAIIYVIIFFLSPFLSRFYNETELEPLLKLVAITFLIIPFGQQHKSLFQKELKFDTISKIEIISRIVSFILSILAALKGWGVYSLAMMVLSNSIISTILLLFKGMRSYRPSFIFSHTEIRKFYSFGFYQLGERTLNYFASQLDTIIIGKLLGASPLGIYTVAKNLIMKPAQIINPIVTKVAFPTMAKVQDNIESIRKMYVNTVRYLSSVNFPIHLGIAILAEPLTIILFGNKWIEAISLIKILALYGMIRSVFNPVGSLILALGRADLGFYWNLLSSIVTTSVIFIGSYWGLKGVAVAQLISLIFLAFPFFLYLIKRMTNAGFWEYHSAILIPLQIAFFASVVPFILEYLITNYTLKILSVCVIGLSIYYLLTLKYNKVFLTTLKSFR
jgi:O-antigen/teichoic acid export membrane protein